MTEITEKGALKNSNMGYDTERSEVGYMDMEPVNRILDEIDQDRTVPRNIRTAIENVKQSLGDGKSEIAVRINNAISILDEVSNDPNIPIYTRTQIWNVVSMLEVLNEEAKETKK